MAIFCSHHSAQSCRVSFIQMNHNYLCEGSNTAKERGGEMRQRQLHWLNNAMHSRQATVSCCHHGYVGIQKQLTHTNLCIKEKSFITLIIQPSSGFQPRFTCPWPSIIALDTCLYIVWPLTCTPWSQRHRSPRQRLSLCYCTETEATNGFNSITAKL